MTSYRERVILKALWGIPTELKRGIEMEEKKNLWSSYDEAAKKELHEINEKYKACLDAGKTERECVKLGKKMADTWGYKNLEDCISEGTTLKAGDKVYADCMGKAFVMFQLGKKPLEEGMNILGAHIDSPRIDVKQNPLYEDSDMAYLDTHYYGGIKKYQWASIPLALHGVVVKKDGSTAEVNIGEDEDDPIVYITDLLIHLAGKQMQKKAAEVIEGENLDILIGSRPLKDLEDDKKKEAVKQNVLNILKEKYDMEEEDFLSAELEIVPAGKARECGLDRSMIAAYGQDDRVCAYTSLLAMLGMDTPKHTSCCLFTDKEEIGSVGATGMQSRFFENAVAELLDAMGCYSDLRLRRTLKNSSMLSSDVSAGYDPAYGEAFEKKNAAYLGRGIVLNKFTGARGKSGSNDANAEYVAWVRDLFEKNKIKYQMSELGKVDVGGGGTIAYILANKGVDVIDCGVGVLSMHAPYEVTSKFDLYEAYRGYKAFWEKN